MKKRRLFLFLLALLIASCCFFSACDSSGQINKNEEEKIVVSIQATIPDRDFVIGANDFSDVIIVITYSNETSDTVALSEDLIAVEDRNKLYEAGKQEIRLIYNGCTTKIYLNMVRAKEVYYTITVTGGYFSEINGQPIVSPFIPEKDESYSRSFPDGTEIVINWKKEGNNNFEYWTVNDVKSTTLASSFKTVVTSDIEYHAYSSAVAKRVIFHTAFEDENVRVETQMTEILNESNIKTITRAGYVFLGWTTDAITKEQALSGYDKNRVKFPYSVLTDVDLYAVWTPIGLVYAPYGDGYQVVSFNGNVTSLSIPEEYEGKKIYKITKDALRTTKGYFLTDVTIPSSVIEIEDGVFSACEHLESINVADESETFISVDGVLFALGTAGDILEELVAYPMARVRDTYTIPDEVRTVRANSFGNASVAGIVLSESLMHIGENAFVSTHVDYVDFSSVNPSVLTLERDLFHPFISKILLPQEKADAFSDFPQIAALTDKCIVDKSALTRLVSLETTEADGKTSYSVYRVIKEKNFENDGDSLELLFTNRSVERYTLQVKVSDLMVTSIAKYAFASCDYLTSFILPLGTRLERVSDNAFDDTPWVSTLKNNVIISQNGQVLYKYLGNDSTVKLERETEKIAEGAFSQNKTLEYIDITDNAAIKTIAAYAFYECTSLKSFIYRSSTSDKEMNDLFLKKAVEKIGAYAFYRTKITNIVLEKESSSSHHSWKFIGEYAFAGCDRLVSVQLSKPMEDIASTAFLGCYALQEFVLTETNATYDVYDGVLYKKTDDGIALFAYPSGRMDAEFDPSVRLNYPSIKEMDVNEKSYMQTDETGEEGSSIGKIAFNGYSFDLYMSLVGLKKTDVTQGIGTDNYLYYRGNKLKETTSYDENGVPNGEKYYYFYDKDNVKRKLLYDEEKETYCYSLTLDVKTICNYSLYYCNFAALIIPDCVNTIEEKAVKIPGLVYARFERDPIVDYSIMFGEYAPDFVILSPDTSSSLKNKFYNDDDELLEAKDAEQSDYVFFYGFAPNTSKYDRNILYAFDTKETGTVKTSVVRTSRTVKSITVPQMVYRNTTVGVETVGSATMSKNVFPYAFFGGILESVYLNRIEKLRNNAFSSAYAMTYLEVDDIFIDKVGENVFCEEMLNKGLFICDLYNTIDLYQSNEVWRELLKEDYFEYTDLYGIERFAFKHLIKSADGAFAVVVYRDGDHNSTAAIKYGGISVSEIDEIEEAINKKGYYISNWNDDKGKEVSVDRDYVIPYNLILTCDFLPEEYDVYLSASPSVRYDYEVISEDESGLITYKHTVEYGSEYSFIPSENEQEKYVFLRTEDDILLEKTGVWDITADGEVRLRVVFGYKLTYDVNKDNASTTREYDYVFNGSSYSLEIPETIDGSIFVGWAFDDPEGNRIMLTDGYGDSLVGWDRTERNDYTVYAVWE